jgi:hypothetical protein
MKSASGLIQVGWHLNLLEYLRYFRYTDFMFHECVSFLYKLMCQTVSRATGTFFQAFRMYAKNCGLPKRKFL